MAKLKISPPWVQYYREVDAMFRCDEDVNVVYDDSNAPVYELKLYVNNAVKADAISLLLPTKKEFGECVLEIEVIPSNSVCSYRSSFMSNPDNIAGVIHEAFNGNPALKYIREISGVFTNPMYFVVFAKEVVQYFTDDLGDLHGVRSTLYQEIAKEIFGSILGVYFCTDVEDDTYLPF